LISEGSAIITTGQDASSGGKTIRKYKRGIKDEIKFLHKKKDKLNRELYDSHLKAAKELRKAWDIIQRSIINDLNHEMEFT
jgi:hypothetical protein